jgi:hypothetical protein
MTYPTDLQKAIPIVPTEESLSSIAASAPTDARVSSACQQILAGLSAASSTTPSIPNIEGLDIGDMRKDLFAVLVLLAILKVKATAKKLFFGLASTPFYPGMEISFHHSEAGKKSQFTISESLEIDRCKLPDEESLWIGALIVKLIDELLSVSEFESTPQQAPTLHTFFTHLKDNDMMSLFIDYLRHSPYKQREQLSLAKHQNRPNCVTYNNPHAPSIEFLPLQAFLGPNSRISEQHLIQSLVVSIGKDAFGEDVLCLQPKRSFLLSLPTGIQIPRDFQHESHFPRLYTHAALISSYESFIAFMCLAVEEAYPRLTSMAVLACQVLRKKLESTASTASKETQTSSTSKPSATASALTTSDPPSQAAAAATAASASDGVAHGVACALRFLEAIETERRYKAFAKSMQHATPQRVALPAFRKMKH